MQQERISCYLKLIPKSIDDIETNLNSDITVKKIATESGVSIWQYQRIFRSVVGDSIGNYIRQRKLSLALRLLKDPRF